MSTYSANTSATYINPNVDKVNDPDILDDQFKAALSEKCRDLTDDFVETGKILASARDSLPHGHFGRLLREMGIERSRATRLMAIADNPAILCNLHNLPPHWTVLELLAKVPEKKLEKLVQAGQVTAESRRKDVMKLLPPKCTNVGCNKPVHKDGYCNQHYVAPEPLTAHDLIVQVLERHKVELRADPDQTRKLVEWLVENVEEGQRETLFKPLADLLPIDREADDSSSNQADDTIIIQLPASPEPSPEPLFENPEDEPAPPEAPADDGLDMPEFLDRKKEIRAVLLKQRPYLRETPEKLEAEVLARIR
jgi:hypothetical protein